MIPSVREQICQWLAHERRQLRSRVGLLEYPDRVVELGARDAERSDEPLVGGEWLEVRRQAKDVVGDPSKLCVTFEDGEGPGGAAVSHEPGQDQGILHERVGEIQGLLLEPVERGALCGGVAADDRGAVDHHRHPLRVGAALGDLALERRDERGQFGRPAELNQGKPFSDQSYRHVRLDAQHVLHVGQGFRRTIELGEHFRNVQARIEIEGIQPRRFLHARQCQRRGLAPERDAGRVDRERVAWSIGGGAQRRDLRVARPARRGQELRDRLDRPGAAVVFVHLQRTLPPLSHRRQPLLDRHGRLHRELVQPGDARCRVRHPRLQCQRLLEGREPLVEVLLFVLIVVAVEVVHAALVGELRFRVRGRALRDDGSGLRAYRAAQIFRGAPCQREVAVAPPLEIAAPHQAS